MTMLDSGNRLLEDGEAATWHEVEKGFWVGSTRGAFVGTVERMAPHRFVARDDTGAPVGEYSDAVAARTAVGQFAETSRGV